MSRLPVLALSLTLLAACQCGADEVTAPSVPALDDSPAPPPQGLLAEACVKLAEADALREALEVPALQAALPANASEALAQLLDVPPPRAIRDAIDPRSELCVAQVDGGSAMAVRQSGLSAGPEAERGPRGGFWSGGALVLGDILVVGESREVIEALAPYLALTLMPTEREPVFVARVADGVLADAGRLMLESALEDMDESAESAIAAERARHDDAPAFGDPEVARRIGMERLRHFLAYLPDLGEVRVSLEARAGALRVRANADVTPGSPLAMTLAQTPERVPAFGALPATTALAYFRAGDAPGERGVIEALLEVGGARIEPDEARALLAVSDALGDAPREVALGVSGDAPWLRFTGTTPDSATLDAALGAPFTRSVIDALFGCEGLSRGWQRGRLACPDAPALSRTDAQVLVARGAPELTPLAADAPHAGRILSGLSSAIFAVYVEPSRVPAALSLFDLPGAPTGPAPTEEPAPVVLVVHSNDQQLAVDLDFAPHSPMRIAAIVLSLSQ